MGKQLREEGLNDESIQLVTFKKFKPIGGDSVRVEVYKNTTKGKEKQRVVRLSHDNVEHVGQNFDTEQPSRPVKYVVGVRNTSTGNIEYHELSQPLVIKLRRQQSAPKHEISRPVYDFEHKMRLVNEMGTNKSRRKMNQLRNNVIE